MKNVLRYRFAKATQMAERSFFDCKTCMSSYFANTLKHVHMRIKKVIDCDGDSGSFKKHNSMLLQTPE